MYVLGVSESHNSTACLLKDGKISYDARFWFYIPEYASGLTIAQLMKPGLEVSKIYLRNPKLKYSAEELDSIKRSLGIKSGPVIGAIGRLSPVKGHRFLIEAMPRIIAGARDAQLLIVGDGPEEKTLRDLAGSLGLEPVLHLTGSSQETRRFLSVMDIFVFPSVKEGLGMALIEALAAGKACVASEVGGIGDIIRDGSNGLLVPVGDPVAIADAVSALLVDRESARRMGENGRAMAKERFSLRPMADRIIALYKEVLG